MSKSTKPLALALAAAFFVSTGASAFACGGLSPNQNGDQTQNQGGQLGQQFGPGPGNQYNNGQGGRLGSQFAPGGPGNYGQMGRMGPQRQQESSESTIFEIVDKEGCTTEACTSLVLQDAYGHRIQIGAIEFDEALTADASLEELTYHLAQNGAALRGRLELGGQAGDRERAYNLLVEKIYS